MKQSDHIKAFTAADIERYHAGQLSMQERHALEKAALDDPFLADALEGYAHTPTPQADLIELQQRLVEKAAPRKRGVYIPLFQKPWIRIAALVLLLAGAGWTVYQFSFVPKEELAITKEVDKSVTDTTPSIRNNTLADSSSLVNNALIEQDVAKTSPASAPKVKQEPIRLQHDTKDTEPASVLSAPVASIEAFKESEQQSTLEKPVARERRVNVAANSPNQSTLNTFRGQIVDPNGNPVPYANIVVNGKQNATTTNVQGQFFLTTPDSVVNATIAAIGFQPNRVNLNNPFTEQKVVLTEAENSLAEVVVTGYGKKRARGNTRPSDAKTKAEVEEIEPEGGWSGFNDYITQNLHIPEEVTQKQLKGEVQLSFEVDKNGEPVNIKVAKSLCTSCDQEAIRLLKEGPGWKKKKKKGGKVTIRF